VTQGRGVMAAVQERGADVAAQERGADTAAAQQREGSTGRETAPACSGGLLLTPTAAQGELPFSVEHRRERQDKIRLMAIL
jgi:hypothetical protein